MVHTMMSKKKALIDAFLNDFAKRCFRDMADVDYITARMAIRAGLVTPFLWASQQTIEKYLKCILLLNRIEAKKVNHNLDSALKKIEQSGIISLELSPCIKEFINRLAQYGHYRYLDVSNFAKGADVFLLDRAVWEIRWFCARNIHSRRVDIREGEPVPRMRIPGGLLEEILNNSNNPAHEPLTWQNNCFGSHNSIIAEATTWFVANNAPLSLSPKMVDEVAKYVHIPKNIAEACRGKIGPRAMFLASNS